MGVLGFQWSRNINVGMKKYMVGIIQWWYLFKLYVGDMPWESVKKIELKEEC